MRPIKFKAVTADGKRWVEGYFIGSRSNEQGGLILSIENGSIHNVNLETVSQFTGLTDKNGKEIWEGDILNYKRHRGDNWASEKEFDKDYESAVCFKNGSFVCEETDKPIYNHIKNIHFNYNNWTQYEVIGNIHDSKLKS